ncbi:calcium-translocating P-type ATPase, partial [Rhizopogon vinicolor AM-OR11-026]
SLDSRSHSPSPTMYSSNDGASLTIPPSPTLSTQSSVHFATSLSLRDNQPEERNGYTSLHLLPDRVSAHHRKASNATFTSSHEGYSSFDETEPDHGSGVIALQPVNSDPTSTSQKSDQENGGISKVELVQDELNDPQPFKFRPFELASLLDPKNLDELEALGGVDALLDGLGTHRSRGVTIDSRGSSDGRPGAGVGASQRHNRMDEHPQSTITVTARQDGVDERSDPHLAPLSERRRVFGENVLPQRASKSLLALMWLALKDKVLVLLSIAAVVSLALGLFQDFGTPLPEGEPPVDWVEGVAIMIAVLIVVVVGSLNDWQKERQFKVLNEKKEERGVKVIRNGVEHLIDEVVVGDVALLEPGEIVPCDGIFLSGYNVKCDESAATGELDAIKKVSYTDCLALHALHAEGGAFGGGQHVYPHTDCFVVSGSKVLEGVGTYVVVAVGTKNSNGRIMMALRTDAENTPLQLKFNILAEFIAKIGSIAGIVLFSLLMVRFIVQLVTSEPARNANQNGMAFIQILIISVTLVVVAVPEGRLPLAVTLALAFVTKRMTKENLLVRVLGSCETMANTSVICTDKTGVLTQNMISVVAGSIGIHAKFVHKLEDNQARTNAHRSLRRSTDSNALRNDFSVDQSKLNAVLSPSLRTLCNEAIAINSTAFEDVDKDTGERMFVGSKTETALLNFARELGWPNYKETRDLAEIIQAIPFSSDRKAMGAVVRHAHGYRLYVKGASEILAKSCKSYVVVHQESTSTDDAPDDVELAEIDDFSQENIARTIIFYASQALRTIALCYRDFPSWPPPGIQASAVDEVPYEEIARDMTLIGIVGIEDPLKDGVRKAQILLQSVCQITVTLLFHFLGVKILGFEETSGNNTIVQTLVFNTFVFAQIFNSLNSRRLDRKLNIFEGMLNNWYFLVITLIEIAVQVVIVFIGGTAFQVTRIGIREWGISLALGFVSIPLGALIRLMPNRPFESLFILMRLLPRREGGLPKVRSDVEWNSAIELVRDNLATFANLRGGRLRSSSFVVKSRQARLHEDKRVPLPSLMTMVPTLIASSIGAGWAPQSRGTLSDPARYDPSKSSAALWEGKLQIHPDTKPDDAVYRTKWGGGNRPS